MERAKPPLIDTHQADAPAEDLGLRPRSRAELASPIPLNDPRRLPVDAAAGVAIAPQRVRGRPQGSTNIKDTEIAQQLIAQYGDPLQADVAIGAMPLGDLITLLRCIASDRGVKLGGTVMEIARFQHECRKAAMPFLHSKRATVDDKGNPVLPIIGIGKVGTLNLGGTGRSIEDMVDAENVTIIQGDSDADGK